MAEKVIRRGRNIDTTTGNIWKQLLLFAIPILITNFLQQLYGSVDMIILGKYGPDNSLAAVGTTTALTNILLGLFVGVATGASVVLSQSYGAGDSKGMHKSVHSTMFLGVASGAILTVVGIFASRPLLELLNCPPELIESASTYMEVIFLGMIPMGVYNMGSAILRSIGDSKRPLYFLIVAAITNIIFDYIFVAWFKWGVAGAAAATILSQTVAAVLSTYILMNANDSYRLYFRDIRPYKESSREIIRIGLPAGMQSVVVSASNTLIQSQVNNFGVYAVEGYSAGNRIDGFYYMSVNAFSVAATTFVGQNMGAKKYDRVKKGSNVALALGIMVCIILGIFLYAFRVQVLEIFNIKPESMPYGVFMMVINAIFYSVFGIGDVLSGAVRGAGKSNFPMISATVNLFVLRLFWIYGIQYFFPTFEAIYWGYVVSWTGQAIMMSTYYLSKRWLPEEARAKRIANSSDDDTSLITSNVSSEDEEYLKELEHHYEESIELADLEKASSEAEFEEDYIIESSEDPIHVKNMHASGYRFGKLPGEE